MQCTYTFPGSVEYDEQVVCEKCVYNKTNEDIYSMYEDSEVSSLGVRRIGMRNGLYRLGLLGRRRKDNRRISEIMGVTHPITHK